MPSTTSFSQGAVVLVPFPFTDLTAIKQRPALVLSPKRLNKVRADLVVAAVTSQIPDALSEDEVLLSEADLRTSGLPKRSPSASKVYRASRIILSQPDLVGYFGSGSGVASQEQYWSAYGLAKAFWELDLDIPAVIRLGGKTEDRAVDILRRMSKLLRAPVEGYRKTDSPAMIADRFAKLVGEAGGTKWKPRKPRRPKFVGASTAVQIPVKGGLCRRRRNVQPLIDRARLDCFFFPAVRTPCRTLAGRARHQSSASQKKIGCRFMKKPFATLPLRTFPAIFKIRWPRTCTWHRCAFAISEFMQSCRVDDASIDLRHKMPL